MHALLLTRDRINGKGRRRRRYSIPLFVFSLHRFQDRTSFSSSRSHVPSSQREIAPHQASRTIESSQSFIDHFYFGMVSASDKVGLPFLVEVFLLIFEVWDWVGALTQILPPNRNPNPCYIVISSFNVLGEKKYFFRLTFISFSRRFFGKAQPKKKVLRKFWSRFKYILLQNG